MASAPNPQILAARKQARTRLLNDPEQLAAIRARARSAARLTVTERALDVPPELLESDQAEGPVEAPEGDAA